MGVIRDFNYIHNDEYYTKIVNFLSKERETNDKQLWEAGRTNFWIEGLHGMKEKTDPFFEENVHLWFDDDYLVALAISEYGKQDMFFETAVGYEHLTTEILNWITNVWNDEGKEISLYCFEDDIEKIQALKKYGFVLYGPREYKRTYKINEIDCEYKTPEGYAIGAFHENPNYDSRVELGINVFNTPGYCKEALINLHESNDYIKELDLGAVSSEGIYSAYCIGWRYPGSGDMGYIEPVGTHSEHRRKGLASCIIKECFQRMRDLGINEVIIASGVEPKVSNFLYDSLNPCRKRAVLEFRR